jgi:hypothetical protein
LTEAVNLYAAALRAHKLLRYDAATMKITNVPDANKYLAREYRSGWGLIRLIEPRFLGLNNGL